MRRLVTIPPPRSLGSAWLDSAREIQPVPYLSLERMRHEQQEATMVHTKAENGAFSLYLRDKVAISPGSGGLK